MSRPRGRPLKLYKILWKAGHVTYVTKDILEVYKAKPLIMERIELIYNEKE